MPFFGPIFLTIPTRANVDPIGFATLAVILAQTSCLTSPVARSIFDLRWISPPEIGYGDMVEGVLPFVAARLLGLALVLAFPALATRPPKALVKGF